MVALAQSCRLGDLVAEKLTLKATGGVNAPIKVPALVAGMVAGADSIDDMDLLRHGGMDRLFAGIRAPSTLGTFLRAFTFGHVRQLDSIAASLLTGLAAATPLLPGAGQVTFLDLDDTMRETHGARRSPRCRRDPRSGPGRIRRPQPPSHVAPAGGASQF